MKHVDSPSGRLPLRIAFIGPWNYSNGLGVGARGYLSALWHTHHILSVHPIHPPFHVHARMTPTCDVGMFTGPADVAIVDLNPDGWEPLLSDAQRRIVDEARARVGLFVWEMDEVPDSWMPVVNRMDAIWTPSRFCADVLARRTARRVDVIPHVVPVAPEVADPKGEPSRTILYAFDGASYLARKRPMALIEAFALAGLGERGWQLVLKTKNLLEAPEPAAALLAAAAATPGVTLITKPLPGEQMAALLERADIYASPHRAEGFGLTIAEAMAHGKVVVATDYGGSRDFLDDSCGFPVAGALVRLEQDHGPYSQGGVWCEVSIPDLADALLRAADLVDAGDHTLGARARARVAERLSPWAVADQMDASLARVARAGLRV